MLRAVVALCAVLLLESACWATPYLFEWNASDGLPEAGGLWTRSWGDWDGLHHGTGANRTIHDGVLTYDSLYDEGVFDGSYIVRLGQFDPDPGEMLIMEWRLRVDQVVGYRADPGVALFSDERWGVGFEFGIDFLQNPNEGFATVSFTPGLFHDYRLVTTDVRAYDLFVDGVLARHGAFVYLPGGSRSYVGWGDAIQGAASLHDWEYFRLTVTPEPSGGCILLAYLVCRVRRRGSFFLGP